MDIERLINYNKDHCWQYEIRLNNYEKDLMMYRLTEDEVKNLRVEDFIFKNITHKKEKDKMILFIKRHEWLGTLSQFTTHWFGAYYNNILAGVVLFNMPNSFSKLLGEDTRKIERLISRGACISWSPKNLASSLLMFSIKWLVKNTRYRLFTAYSDPIAGELGIIYQACNFYYIGQKAGTTKRFINPYTNKFVSDRYFRVRSAYKKYAKELGIKWQKNWNNDQRMLWDNVPGEVEEQLRNFSKQKQKNSDYIEFPNKHKYAYVLGIDKKETKRLRRLFLSKNKIYKYPKKITRNTEILCLIKEKAEKFNKVDVLKKTSLTTLYDFLKKTKPEEKQS